MEQKNKRLGFELCYSDRKDGAGGGGLGIEFRNMIWDAIGKKVDEIIAKFKRWLPLIKLVGKAFACAWCCGHLKDSQGIIKFKHHRADCWRVYESRNLVYRGWLLATAYALNGFDPWSRISAGALPHYRQWVHRVIAAVGTDGLFRLRPIRKK